MAKCQWVSGWVVKWSNVRWMVGWLSEWMSGQMSNCRVVKCTKWVRNPNILQPSATVCNLQFLQLKIISHGSMPRRCL
jgi:hypothetical protein